MANYRSLARLLAHETHQPANRSGEQKFPNERANESFPPTWYLLGLVQPGAALYRERRDYGDTQRGLVEDILRRGRAYLDRSNGQDTRVNLTSSAAFRPLAK